MRFSRWGTSYKIKPIGDSAIGIFFDEKIDERVNDMVIEVSRRVEKRKTEGIIEVVPTYRTVCVYYNPLQIEYERLVETLREIVSETKVGERKERRVVKIPVAYGGDFGPDLKFVAEYNGLTEDDVIEIHSKPTYRVYMLGFTPGFAYMGGLDERIAAPRLETPRKRVPAGSVGIAGKQTGIYPIESPGGWRLIGRTPLKLFDPKKDPPTLLLPGDLVKFVPIDKEEFYRILKEESK